MIDKNTILSLVDTYKDFYIQQRNDPSRAEAYKREKLPVIHDEIFGKQSESVSLHDKLVYLDKNKQNRVSYMGNISDLITIQEKHTEAFKTIRNSLFDDSTGLAERIDTCREQYKELDADAKIGSALFGYLYATYDSGQYPLYKDSVFLRLRNELDKNDEWKSFSIGEKYETFTEICTIIGDYLKADLQDIPHGDKYTALDGQDFLYVVSQSIIPTVLKFLEQAQRDDLTTSHYIKEYKGLKVKVSFGQGMQAHVPWICFLREGQKVSQGIYPGIGYHKAEDILVLDYGVSNQNKPLVNWGEVVEDKISLDEYYEQTYGTDTKKYGTSKIEKVYNLADINKNLFDLQTRLDKIIEIYKSLHLGDRKQQELKNWLLTENKKDVNDTYKKIILCCIALEQEKNANAEGYVSRATIKDSQIMQAVDASGRKLNKFSQAFNFEDKYETNSMLSKLVEYKLRNGETDPGTPKSHYKVHDDYLPALLGIIEEDNIIDILLERLRKKNPFGKRVWLIAPGPNAQDWEYFQNKGIIGIGWNDLGDLSKYNNKKDIAQKLQELEESSSSQRNNAHACWEFANVMQPDDIVIAKQGTRTYLGWGVVTGEYQYDNTSDMYYHTRIVDWIKTGERDEPKHDIVQKTLTDISKYPDYVKRLKDLLDITDLLSEIPQPMTSLQEHPLNQILYGVPGTGKTYSTVNYAVAIIENKALEEIVEESSSDEGAGRESVLERYNSYKENGQIVFTTFHQSFGYEDFIEGLKATTSDEGDISYDIEPGVFKAIASKAKKNIEKSHLETKEDDEEYVSELINNFATYVNQQLESGPYTLHGEVLIDSVRVGNDGSFKSFVTGGSVNEQSLTRSIILRDYKNFKQGNISSYHDIQPTYESKASYHGNAPYYYYLLEKLREFEQEHFSHIEKQDVTEEVKNYVLIIDEINRGNISKIFGELITLIEPDKRLGNQEALTVTLPYSKESFGVPSNLYLLGTMNTADRSIALMDIALRRRFHFKELPPQSELLENMTVEGVEIAPLLDTINERITMLYDKDHQIGHAYFMGAETLQDLITIFEQKILPLLQEYFYDDWEKIQIVLGDHPEQKFKEYTNKIIQESINRTDKVLGFSYENTEDEYTYEINKELSPESFRGIYESTLTTDDQ